MSYFYEIHVLVNPEQELVLENFVLEEANFFKQFIRPRKMTTVTSTGQFTRQPMFTCMVKCATYDESIDKMKLISKKIQEKCSVVREKVEGSHVDSNLPIQVENLQYYEFHTKVLNVLNNDSWTKLAKLCLPFGVGLLYNSDSKLQRPVTTLRCYDTSYQEALQLNNKLNKELLDNGFTLDTTHCEYSLYDTNVYTDSGWMFDSNPKEFITNSNDPLKYTAPAGFLVC